MSWHFLQEQAEASWEANSLDGAPCALLRLIPTAEACCLQDNATESLNRSRSGTTCGHLTGDSGAEPLTLCREASPARTSAQPEKAQGLTASAADCGWKWPGSFAKYDPALRLWRTRQCSLLGDSEEFSETWPKWGSMQSGECLEQMTLVPRTSEKESGSWPTPRRTDADRGGRGDLIQAVRGNANSHYKYWATPQAHDAKKGDAKRVGRFGTKAGGRNLNDEVAKWPTPHGFSKDGKSNGPSGNELGRAVNKMQDANGGSLNPDWVEWLMGWPIGWTDLKPLEMDKCRAWLQAHGICL